MDQAGDGDRSRSAEVVDRVPLLAFLGLEVVETHSTHVYSVSMKLGPRVQNPLGVPHGGAVATLMDHTGGMAASELCGRGGPTVDLHVRYLATPRDSSSIRADATVVQKGRSLIVVEIKVHDDHERLLAIGSLTVAPRPDRLEPTPD